MLACRIWRDDGLGSTLSKPVTEAFGIVGTVCNETQRAGYHRQQSASTVEVVGIAWSELESEGPAAFVGQGVDFRRPAAPRAPDGVAEGPPFAPAAERWALMWVESTATVPTMPVAPVSA
jgi:hypothetical protein